MTNEEQWAERVRAWRASGRSKADFCRNETYTASGLGYWVKRLELASTKRPARASSVRLARVVRSNEPTEVPPPPIPRGRPEPCSSVVVEVIAMRAVVPQDRIGSDLDAVIASLTRGWGGGRT